ncbi:MAG: TM0106 family RecB-like putative nuclease [Acidobacteriota bacterium]|nr:MAG: TM0106 family RecB-like putative nuclease [Acidobacteriota bacterium]
MPSDAVIRASDLYELAVCFHRISLDRRRPHSERAVPDEASRLLAERGLELERAHAERLGWPQPEYSPPDFPRGAERTAELLQRGVEGVYQAVLYDGRFLAIPDFVRRVPGRSAFGDFHYEPGDVKAGLEPRADHVLQVALAGWLLERCQQRAPQRGFLWLGDGREEVFSLTELRYVLDAARRRVAAIVDGEEQTQPFWSAACGRCRWRERCLPELIAADDLSLVDGMTRTRRRVLERSGLATVAALAAHDPTASPCEDRPALGLEHLVRQARALAQRRVTLARPLELPATPEGELLVHAERDPLEREQVVLLAWRARCEGQRDVDTVRVLLNDTERADALRELVALVEKGALPLLHFGSETPRALSRLAERVDLSPRRQAALDDRLWDLAVTLRRAAAYLPVRRYTLDEVTAAIAGNEPTGWNEPPFADLLPAFVLLDQLRRDAHGPWRQSIVDLGLARLGQLGAIVDWIRRSGCRWPRQARGARRPARR